MIIKKRILPLLIYVCIGFTLFPIFSGADMGSNAHMVVDFNGPESQNHYVKLSKINYRSQPNPGLVPSIDVDFIGLKGQTYYATLLSITESVNPYNEHIRETDGALYDSGAMSNIALKFSNYKDVDGYYFLQRYSDCTNSHNLHWSRYIPAKFKILIYFPDCDAFVVSAMAYERYAFDSKYTVSVVGTPSKGTAALSVEQKYHYSIPVVPLITSIIVTIALELAIALVFGYRRKKQLKFILKVNVATQIALNVALLIVNYHAHGAFAFLTFYALLEIVVIAVEAGVYCALMQKYSKLSIVEMRRLIEVYGASMNMYTGEATPKWKAVVYALSANTAAFAAGLGLAILIPGLF